MSYVKNKIALVTGANRGIGRAFVEELLVAGTKKVYATARDISKLDKLVKENAGRVVPLELDVTSETSIAAAAQKSNDVDVVFNNAGIATFEGLIASKNTDQARNEMETNYFGTLNVTRAFAPILKANNGGAVVNISSIAGHVNFPALGSYSASKAAVHSLTQGVRAELALQGTKVFGVYPGPVDTELAEAIPMDKADPNAVVINILKAMEAGEEDIFPDVTAAEMYAGHLSDPKALERSTGEMLPQ